MGVTCVVVGLPFLIIGWVMFGLARKEIGKGKQKKVSILMEYQGTKVKEIESVVGLRIRL